TDVDPELRAAQAVAVAEGGGQVGAFLDRRVRDGVVGAGGVGVLDSDGLGVGVGVTVRPRGVPVVDELPDTAGRFDDVVGGCLPVLPDVPHLVGGEDAGDRKSVV